MQRHLSVASHRQPSLMIVLWSTSREEVLPTHPKTMMERFTAKSHCDMRSLTPITFRLSKRRQALDLVHSLIMQGSLESLLGKIRRVLVFHSHLGVVKFS